MIKQTPRIDHKQAIGSCESYGGTPMKLYLYNSINSVNFFNLEFLQWTFHSLNLVRTIVSVKNQDGIANSVDPDEMRSTLFA